MTLSLKLPDPVARGVRELAEAQKITATEVLRRGVSLAQFVSKELDDGNKFLLQRADGSLEWVHFVW